MECNRSYSELILLKDFDARLEYLTLLDYNYNSPREESLWFFTSQTWRAVRKQIISRDLAFDLGVFGVYIPSKVLVHHINPITVEDLKWQTPKLLDPENLITVSIATHNSIHYGKPEVIIERTPGDTILW